jgi:NAD(P)-dependent dehydrogenase (short-subunit alcohol dehydrogenase family)
MELSMSTTLKGKIALVTGASRGIGRAIAERLAADGAVVGVHYGRNPQAADEVVAAIKAKGGDAFAVGAELTESGAAAKLFAQVDAELAKRGKKTFDILVNNAGVAPFVAFADTTEEQFDYVFNVNVKSLFFITQAAVSRLNDGGRIISTTSVVSRLPFPGVEVYSMSKPPVDNLTKALAKNLGERNITVNAVAPGVIETDMTGFVKSDEGTQQTLSMQALKHIGQAPEIADVVAFLAGPDARWITGQTIEVSGGTLITM